MSIFCRPFSFLVGGGFLPLGDADVEILRLRSTTGYLLSATGLEVDSQRSGGDDVLLLDAVGHQRVVFVVEVDVERDMLAELGAEGCDGGDDVVVADARHGVHHRGLPEGGVLEGDARGELVAHLEAQGEAADHLFERDRRVAILGVVLHVGGADGVVAVGVPEDAVLDAGEEAEAVVETFEAVVEV